jgi:hypothetical protein
MYLTTLIGLSAISVVLSLFVLSVHHMDPSIKMPHWLHILVFKFLAFITCNCGKSKLLQKAKVSPERVENIPMNVYEELQSSMPELKRPCSAHGDPSHRELVAIRKLLGAIYQHNVLPSGEKKPEVNKWKLAASIIDRFFLILYLVVTVSVTMALIGPAYSRHNSINTIGANNSSGY